MIGRRSRAGHTAAAAKGFTVALIGPDGAGKTTLSTRLPRCLGMPARHVYMGINLESSNVLLPTTRLLLEAKRMRGRRPDITAPLVAGRPSGSGTAGNERPGAPLKTIVRTLNLIAEEWFRRSVIWWYARRGEVVVLDRHFFFDYYHADVAPEQPVALIRRVHGHLLRRVYPKPDLTILLDAPGQVLFARKGESDVEELERRRAGYLDLLKEVPRSAVVDATQPVDDVLAQVVGLIHAYELESHHVG